MTGVFPGKLRPRRGAWASAGAQASPHTRSGEAAVTLPRLCGPYEIKACQRHLDNLKRQGTNEFPYVFDAARADRIIRWFGQCIQVRGVESREPIQFQPWQVFAPGLNSLRPCGPGRTPVCVIPTSTASYLLEQIETEYTAAYGSVYTVPARFQKVAWIGRTLI